MYGVEFRPRDFQGIRGIPVVKEIVQKILKSQEYDPAYLFEGAHSTGKTTLGQIMARAILCQNRQPDMSPCNQCRSCKDFLRGSHTDYLEIDAANNGSKDRIKDIREMLQYSTASGYRIILFDEAHSVSKEGKDALLMELEKGMKNIILMFCTTEIEKMPSTLRSRCIEFKLPNPTETDIYEKLQYICDQKSIKYDREGLLTIIRATGRHYRDAENRLRQISLLGDVVIENVKKIVSLFDEEISAMLLTIEPNINKSLELVDHICSRMDVKGIYFTVLRLLTDAIKSMRGLSFESDHYTRLLKLLIKQYGYGLFELLDYIISRKRIDDIIFLQSDLLIMHYKMKKGGFKSESIEQGPEKKRGPVASSNSDPEDITKRNDLQPWEKEDLIRKIKNEKLLKGADKSVAESVSKVWGPDTKSVPDSAKKKKISPSEFMSIISGGSVESERI